jgi:hypothetical protein
MVSLGEDVGVACACPTQRVLTNRREAKKAGRSSPN